MDHLIFILGIALVGVAMLQFGLWTGRGLRLRRLESRRFELEMEKLRAEIFQITRQRPKDASAANEETDSTTNTTNSPREFNGTVDASGHWNGFRPFVVAKLVRETNNCTSVYLAPADGKPIVGYLPGQHTTVRLDIPGQSNPTIRCYTLSDRSNGQYYRISVKVCPSPNPADVPSGLASTWINQSLSEGQQIGLKAPGGNFYMPEGDSPVVLLAGGIGITPMLAMLNALVGSGSKRECLLFYGVHDGEDHTFKRHLNEIATSHSNINVVNFYSKPSPTDHPKRDFQIQGHVRVDLLQQVLPNKDFDFYLCGPPPFMKAIYAGLIEWGVDATRIRYEAFGPASIGQSKVRSESETQANCQITLSQSQKQIQWDGSHDNLLELIEEQDVVIDSGCRAGSCGTCQTRVLQGGVEYDDPEMVNCEDGYCLPCIARPKEAIELDV